MSKSPKNNGPLSPGTVKFARKFQRLGGENLIDYFAEEDSTLAATKVALTLAFMHRICHVMSGTLVSTFRPIALNWELRAKEKQQIGMGYSNQHMIHRLNGDSTMSDQFQPELPATKVNVLENLRLEKGKSLLMQACRHKVEESELENHLKEKSIGLGLAHAKEIAQEVVINTYHEQSSRSHPLFDLPLGRSIFFLLDYHAFADWRDKQGVRTLAWMEMRRVTEREGKSDNTIQVGFYSDLDILIPQHALVVCAGINWFEVSK